MKTAAVGIVGIGLLLGVAVLAQNGAAQGVAQHPYAGKLSQEKPPARTDRLVLSDAEWKKRLTPEQYRILRGHGTEAAFCSPMHDDKKPGTYYCAGCDLPLFRSNAKFTSGTGWPSFFQPASLDAVWLRTDRSYGMVRQEVLCARCDGHLGHVFDDGPRDKTGLRFCMNGAALKFVPAKPAKG